MEEMEESNTQKNTAQEKVSDPIQLPETNTPNNTTSVEGQISPPEPENLPEVNVMIAGLSRSGKSTALNNIFDLNLEAKASPESVTKLVVHKKITKNGVDLNIIDTPGLKAVDVDELKVLQAMVEYRIRKGYLLLMTLSVAPNSIIGKDYLYTIENLTSIFGKEIWNRCIILLSYSDTAQREEFDEDADGYQEYLQGHCKKFEKQLKVNGVERKVMLFSRYDSEEKFEKQILDGVVAIPVAKRSHVGTNLILPGLTWAHRYSWTDLIITELSKLQKKVNPREVGYGGSALIRFKYGCYAIQNRSPQDTIFTVASATVGGVVLGARYGFRSGNSGAVVIGAVAGGVGGAVCGLAGTITMESFID